MAGSDLSDPAPAAVRSGRERREQRAQSLDHRRIAADHQAVALLQPPYPAAGAGVHVIDALLREGARAALRIPVVRVAAVDDRVTGGEQRLQRADRAVGDLAGGHHHPQGTWRLEFCNGEFERGRRLGTLAFEELARGLRRIVADDAVSAAHQTLRHVRTHPAETNHGEFHRVQPSSRERLGRHYRARREHRYRETQPRPAIQRRAAPGMGIARWAFTITITAGLPTGSKRPVNCRAPLPGAIRNDVIESAR